MPKYNNDNYYYKSVNTYTTIFLSCLGSNQVAKEAFRDSWSGVYTGQKLFLVFNPHYQSTSYLITIRIIPETYA